MRRAGLWLVMGAAGCILNFEGDLPWECSPGVGNDADGNFDCEVRVSLYIWSADH